MGEEEGEELARQEGNGTVVRQQVGPLLLLLRLRRRPMV